MKIYPMMENIKSHKNTQCSVENNRQCAGAPLLELSMMGNLALQLFNAC